MLHERITWFAVILIALLLVGSGSNPAPAQQTTGSDKGYTSTDRTEQLKNIMERWAKLKEDNNALKRDFQQIKEMEEQRDLLAAKVQEAKAQLDQQQASSSGNGPYKVVSPLDIVNDDFYFGRSRKSFDSYEEAEALAKNTSRARVVDRDGKTVTESPTPADPAALQKAKEAYINASLDYDRQSRTYENRKAEYDKKRDQIDTDLDLIKGMINALREAKGGKTGPKYTLTFDEGVPKNKLDNPKYPFRVSSEKMPPDLVGKNVGSGQCVALVQEYSKVGPTKDWRKGEAVKGAADIPPGTPIATFNDKRRYESKKTGNHAALYLKQDEKGIYVLDQYFNKDGTHKDVGVRLIRFISEDEKEKMLSNPKRYGRYSPSNDANTYSVITSKGE
jgi:hypothetical protein